MIQSYSFWSEWDINEQKICYGTYQDINEPLIVCLKEYMSDVVLWSRDYDVFPKDVAFWMIPISKNVYNYETDPYFSGVKICIYKKLDEKKIYEYPYFTKFVDLPRVSLSNTIPYHYNYSEFFIENKYKRFFKDKKFKNVIDVGANIGIFTEYLLYHDITNQITSIECDSKALNDLNKNFKKDPRVNIIAKALHYEETSLSFYQSENNPVISSTIHPDRLKNHNVGIKGDKEVKVETITIEDLLSIYGFIDLLKIDIEGGEYDVIENTDSKWFSYINNVFIECHFFEENYKEKYNNILTKLKSVGYNIEEYEENQSTTYLGGSEIIFGSKK
jgi:FkbM family methyltransferase